jgi:hypothetical protein
LKFVNLGRFAKLPKDSLTLWTGQFELDLPFTQARSYDIYTQQNIGTAQQFVNNKFAIADVAQGKLHKITTITAHYISPEILTRPITREIFTFSSIFIPGGRYSYKVRVWHGGS